MKRIEQDELNDRLFEALKNRDEDKAMKLIRKGADVNAVRDGETPLIAAILSDNTDILVSALIDSGAKVDPSNEGLITTPLLAAISKNDVSTAFCLMCAGADVNKPEGENLPLWKAASRPDSNDNFYANLKIVKELIENGADADFIFKLALTQQNYLVASHLMRCGGAFESKAFVNKLLDERWIYSPEKTVTVLNSILKELPPELPQSSIVKWLMYHGDGIQFRFKYNDFILISQISGFEERGLQYNIKDESKTYFQDGEIYYSDKQQLVSECTNYLFVVDKKGVLYIHDIIDDDFSSLCHSDILHSKPGKPMYGVGKPTACGGHLDIENGKIIAIINDSGHYTPNDDQFKLVLYYLQNEGVLTDTAEIIHYEYDSGFINEPYKKYMKDFDSLEILGRYQEIECF